VNRSARPALVLLASLLASPAPGLDDAQRAIVSAAARGDGPRIVALLAGGADPDARDPDGRPALLLAVASGQASAVRALLRGGAAPDDATRSGWTALHEAAREGALESARALLDAGAGPDRRDRVRATPLDVAEEWGHDDLARLLRARGARGSGMSVGDTVCVRIWKGDGYCAVVTGRDPTRHRLRVDDIVGCPSGCAASKECSEGRDVGPGGLSAGDTLWVPTSCLTQTGLR
jgi:hypothetical protein